DRRLLEYPVQRRVERLRRREVAAERLLEDHPRALGASRRREPVDDGREEARRGREGVGRPDDAPQPPTERFQTPGLLAFSRPLRARSFATPASSMPPPWRSMLSRARARSCSTVHPGSATPITGASRTPRRVIAYSAGKIFL